MLGEVVGRGSQEEVTQSIFLPPAPNSFGEAGGGDYPSRCSVDGGPYALGFLDFCLGSAHPWAMSPPNPQSLQACLQMYETGTHKPGASAFGTGPSTFKAHIGLLMSHGPAQNGRNGAWSGPAYSIWPGPEPIAADGGTWGGLVGDG